MPRGSKDKYTDKQKRKATHIEESYEERGVSPDEAERRAWATVNKQDGGGREGGRLARDGGDGSDGDGSDGNADDGDADDGDADRGSQQRGTRT